MHSIIASSDFKANSLYISPHSQWNSFKNGDSEALQNIYTDYFDLLCLYGRQFAPNDPLLVEDCIQDLFIKLYTNANKHNLAETNSIKFYLMKSLRRSILNVQKNNKKKNVVIASELTDVLDSYVDIFQDEDTALKSSILKKMILCLPARQKEAVYLRYYSELDFQLIADKMHLDIKSVYKLIYKAIQSMRKMSQEEHAGLCISK